MEWTEDKRCPCGKGTITYFFEEDGYAHRIFKRVINCPICSKKLTWDVDLSFKDKHCDGIYLRFR